MKILKYCRNLNFARSLTILRIYKILWGLNSPGRQSSWSVESFLKVSSLVIDREELKMKNLLFLFKVIPRKKKLANKFFYCFLNVLMSLPMSVAKNTIKKRGYIACLRDRQAKLILFMPVLALIMCTISSIHITICSGWKQGYN